MSNLGLDLASGGTLQWALMFIGHFAVGFGAKAAARKVSLGTLFLAAQFVDLLWPTLLLLGLERVAIRPGITRVTPFDFEHYPISHSAVSVLLWATVFGAVFYLARRSRIGALVLAAAVVSHWLLDALTHRPDLPLVWGGEARIGLGLWNSVAGTLAIELMMFAIGVAFYLRSTRASDRTGTLGLWSLVAFLLLVYLGNLFGTPPPSSAFVAWAGQAQWILVVWGYWIDRHRESV